MEKQVNILNYLTFETPTIEQTIALKSMAEFVDEKNTEDFFTLCGAAGTGKSSITSALIGYLNALEIEYNIAAPTGRAARILGRKTNCLSNTIHSLIYLADSNKETGEVTFVRKTNDETDVTIFIIDEASMISTISNNSELTLFKSKNTLIEDLIAFVKQGNSKNKMIFLGDRNQLPPINERESFVLSPEFLSEKFNLSGKAHFLTEVKRQEKDSYIMNNAIQTRIGIEQTKEKVKIDAYKFSNLTSVTNKFVYDFNNNEKDHCISINATHKGNELFNRIVREKLFGKTVRSVVKSDWMIITQKWERNGHQLFSGDHVSIMDVDYSRIEKVAGLSFLPVKLSAKALDGSEIIIDDFLMLDSINYPAGCLDLAKEKSLRGERFRYNSKYRDSGMQKDDKFVGAIRMTHGYSITCNKAQGGEWNKVFMSTFFIPTLKYQYTAITRAVKELVLY